MAVVDAFAIDVLPEVTKFEAYRYSDFSYITGDWAIGMYNDNSNNPVFEIDIISGDDDRIAGSYTLSESGYDNGQLYSCYVVFPEGEGTTKYYTGQLEISFVKTDFDPYYRFLGTISMGGDETLDIDLTIPCVYALDYLKYILGGEYDITLLDDPEAVDPNVPLEPTGEIKQLAFGTDVRFQDQTKSYGYWQIEGYTADNEYLVTFSPTYSNHVAGSYSTNEMDDYYTILTHYPDTPEHRFIKFQSGKIIVSQNGNDVTVDADVVGYDGIEYKICISTDESANIELPIKNTETPSNRKLLKDRKVMIIKDGKVYDLKGCRRL